MRIWCKLIKDNRLLKDLLVEKNDPSMTRTMKVYACLEEACHEMDLEKPLWLEKNKKEFLRYAGTRFDRDSFIEAVDFDYMDFHVIEEDY